MDGHPDPCSLSYQTRLEQIMTRNIAYPQCKSGYLNGSLALGILGAGSTEKNKIKVSSLGSTLAPA